MGVKQGFEAHGEPGGEREFRPPAEVAESSALIEFISFATHYLIAILYGLVLAVCRTFYRIFVRGPVSIKGRVCFVSGSGRGLGRDICLRLAKHGAILALADINEATNKETLKMVEDLGAKAKMYTLNICNKSEVEETVSRIEMELGPVYLVVNNAALVMPMLEPTEDFTRATFNVNVLGHIWVIKAFLPYLRSRDEGHIINIGSISSLHAMTPLDEYSASKAAIRSLSQSLGLRLRSEKSNIKVTCMHPTVMNTTEDYSAMLHKSSVRAVSTRGVINQLMWAVKYDLSGDFSFPFYMKFGLLSLSLLPIEAMKYLLNATMSEVLLPNKEEYKGLPSGRLVRLCTGKSSSQKETTKNGSL